MPELTYYYKMPDGSLSERTRTVARTSDNERSAPAIPPGAVQLTEDQYRVEVAALHADYTARKEAVRKAERLTEQLRPVGLVWRVPGPVTDASITDIPAVDGLMVVDTLNERLYVRLNGVWKYVALTDDPLTKGLNGG